MSILKGIAAVLYFVADLLSGKNRSENAKYVAVEGSSPIPRTLWNAIIEYQQTSDAYRQQQLTQEVRTLAQSFDDWFGVASRVSSSSPLWQLAISELSARANSFSQYEKVYMLASQPMEKTFALEKMTALAQTLEEKIHVYNWVGADSPVGQAMFKQITAEAKTLDEWDNLFRNSEVGSPLERFALEQMISIAETLENLVELACLDQISDTNLESVVMAKLSATTASFEDWQGIANNYSGNVEVLAFDKMISLASTIEEMLECAEQFEGEDEPEKKLVEKAETSFLWTEEACRNIIDNYDSDNVLFPVALRKYLETKQTAEKCLEVYFEWDFDDGGLEIIFKKLLSIVTASELAIIAVVAEEGTSLREWAEEQVSSKS